MAAASSYAASAAALIAFACLVVGARAHARFVCPMPMDGNSGNKVGPCGQGEKSGQYTVVAPGPLTVRFEETIYHVGSPTAFRLFRRGATNSSCLLLDHMPHADSWTRDIYCYNIGFPVGRCNRTTAYVTINIPDVNCDDCVLQLVSVMTDKSALGQRCVEKDLSVNCSTYYSCANIRILGKKTNFSDCSYEANLAGDWPYRNLTPGVYEKGEGSLSFSPIGWLSGADFIGATARYPQAVTPSGTCAPPSTRYAATFVRPDFVGVVSLVLNDVHLFFSGMLSAPVAHVWLEDQSTGSSVFLPPSAVKDNAIFGSINFNLTRGTFFSSVRILLRNNSTLSSLIVPAVVTASFRKDSTHYGEAVYTADGRRSIAISGLNGLNVKSLTVNGPSKAFTADVTERFEHLLAKKGNISWFFGEWDAFSGAKNLSNGTSSYSTTAYFWLERAYMELVLNSSSREVIVTSRVPKPANCGQTEAETRCINTVFNLYPTQEVSLGGPNVTVSGLGTLAFDGRVHTYTLALENIRSGEKPVGVTVLGEAVDFEIIPTQAGDDVAIIAGTVTLPANATAVSFVVTTTVAKYAGSLSSKDPHSETTAQSNQTTATAQTTRTTGAASGVERWGGFSCVYLAFWLHALACGNLWPL